MAQLREKWSVKACKSSLLEAMSTDSYVPSAKTLSDTVHAQNDFKVLPVDLAVVLL